MPSPETFPTLSKEGFGLADVGVRGGLHPLFQEVGPFLRAVGFEPDTKECRRLQENVRASPRGKASYLPCALGEADGEREFHFCRSEGTSSFYRPNRTWLERFPNPERYDVLESRLVPVRSLDSLLSESNDRLPAFVDFLKIDAQGAALEILRGARKILSSEVIGLEVEVEFSRFYETQPLFGDVDAYVSELGFTLFKLRRKSWVRKNCRENPAISAGQVVAADALYLRDPLEPSGSSTFEWSAHAVEALLLAACLYDLNDLALEILAEGRFSGLVPSEKIRRYIQWRSHRLDYRANGSRWIGTGWGILRECLKGRTGLGNLYEWTRRRSWGRADSDKDFYTRTTR